MGIKIRFEITQISFQQNIMNEFSKNEKVRLTNNNKRHRQGYVVGQRGEMVVLSNRPENEASGRALVVFVAHANDCARIN